jgi:LPXTG-motif cell wall-anchored protein
VPAEVEDTTVDRTPSNVDQGTLPRTGSTTGSLLAIGVSLLVLGALFIQRSRVLAAR